jgi:hypothetical protein
MCAVPIRNYTIIDDSITAVEVLPTVACVMLAQRSEDLLARCRYQSPGWPNF